MRLSRRTSWNLAENAFTLAVREAREKNTPLVDLTTSNPTACGFDYFTDLLLPLSQPGAELYVPEPFGMISARSAVAEYYRDHGAVIDPRRICLTTSTSEAYSYLFRLLCDPGDAVHAAHQSYPLFDFLGQLDDVELRKYPLFYDGHTWSIDLHALETGLNPRSRAVLLVHPNNPTGNYASATERAALQQLCAERNLALIVDEVFLDYGLDAPAQSFAAGSPPCLTFVLSGLSKVCALPQMKCSWILTSGPAAFVDEALARLEVIADTFLSMNAPVQFALPSWLTQRGQIQDQIRNRMRTNLAALDDHLCGRDTRRLAMQAGWTTLLHLTHGVDALTALNRGVIVQPGGFYGLPDSRAVPQPADCARNLDQRPFTSIALATILWKWQTFAKVSSKLQSSAKLMELMN